MDSVGIAELKAHLSEYLGRVRNGETIEVCDRKTPIARITPVNSSRVRISRPATISAHDAFASVKPVKLARNVDILAMLREDRDYR